MADIYPVSNFGVFNDHRWKNILNRIALITCTLFRIDRKINWLVDSPECGVLQVAKVSFLKRILILTFSQYPIITTMCIQIFWIQTCSVLCVFFYLPGSITIGPSEKFPAVFRVRFQLIRIQHFRLNADPDPDPGFWPKLNIFFSPPGSEFRIWIRIRWPDWIRIRIRITGS